MYRDIEKRRKATRLRVRRYRAKKKGLQVTNGVTGDPRRVIRTDHDTWFPQIQPTEEKLCAKIKEAEEGLDQAYKVVDAAKEELLS